MSITAYEGGAGSGKTYSVFERLRDELENNPLEPHQKVLALTYMHGARHRLNEQFEKHAGLIERYDASTLDSFVWRLCKRWRGRLVELGYTIPADNDYQAISTCAVALLGYEDVCKWVTAVYPIIVVDEAQDLERTRLQVLEQIAETSSVFLAYDEFQCLNNENRPVAVLEWIKGKCEPVPLSGCRRTSVGALLTAASELRAGKHVTITTKTSPFRVLVTPYRPKVGPYQAAAAIGYKILAEGTFALLTPSREAPFAKSVVHFLQTKEIGKGKIGPFPITWEGLTETRLQEVKDRVLKNDEYSVHDAKALLEEFSDYPGAQMTAHSLDRIYRARGDNVFQSTFLIDILEKHAATVRHHMRKPQPGPKAMTIHQAKNREFDHVAVVWPFNIPASADDRRRLLYNAVTRARKSCLVVVQSVSLIEQAPFV